MPATRSCTQRSALWEAERVRSSLVIRRFLAVFPIAVTVLLAPPASAHRDDYIDETFVYQTLGARERELEGWAEIRTGHDRNPRFWYTGAFEYGITSHWTLDGAAQWVHDPQGVGLGRLRSETRYRFAEEGRNPVDFAASLEYEAETHRATQDEAERILTPRLVVSRDVVPALNTTVNLDFPVTLSPGGGVEFRYAIGVRYPADGFLRYGTEFKQAPGERSAILFPQLWFAMPKEVTFKLGVGIGLASQDDPIVARAVVESEF
jgi:hypothetical protein